MGVPAFYRWLSEKYPKIIVDCVEAEPEWVEGTEVPVDTSQPNPNEMEFDNLYLDMNNIIHPCFHPEDRPAPTTETEVFLGMFEYMDRLFGIVRPRKLLYMAIDGVAPRAKMNQQRSRRFRAAQEREQAAEEEKKLRADMAKQGIKLPEKEDSGHTWDSNTITPGTPFMHRASVALQYYIHLRLNSDPGWRDITVILSDSNSPGEGEHKIMNYVREQRGRPGWNPDTKHCLYGLDADLIMLGLATHEPNFVILREIVTQPNRGEPPKREQMHTRDDPSALMPAQKPMVAKKPYQFLLISVLREYLALEFEPQRPLPFPYDPERIVDDFVFMCFFVGNDFLPHMPTLEIREGAIETLMAVYRHELPAMAGYLTEGAKVHLDKVEYFIQMVGRFEDAIFQKRARLLASQRARRERDKQRAADMKEAGRGGGRGRGRGRPAGKWTANAPSEDYRQSLFAIGSGSGGPPALPPGVKPPPLLQSPGKPQQQQPPLQQPIANGHAASAPAAACDLRASTDGGSNKSAAQALRDRMRSATTGKRDSPEADNPVEAAPKRVKLEDGGSAPPTAAEPPAAAGAAVPARPGTPTAMAQEPDLKAEEGAAVELKAEVKTEVKLEETGATGGEVVEDGEEDVDIEVDDAVSQDSEAALRMREEEEEAEEQLAQDLELSKRQAEAAEAEAQLKAVLAATLKERGDAFDTMVESEQRIRLGEDGWKERYYQEKTGLVGEEQAAEVAQMVKSYVEGLCWVMAYYYDGVASWTWFYPFHYAPFASDLKGLTQLDLSFQLGEPFAPFNQLMGVLPAGSKHCLPAGYQPLFDEAESPILDFYPSDFTIDMNGKRFAWQGVALLPFIDERRLLEAVAPKEATLTEEEKYRNAKRNELLFMASWHPLAPDALTMAEEHSSLPNEQRAAFAAPVDPSLTKGMNGYLLLTGGEACPAVVPAPFDLGPDLTSNAVAAAGFRLPPHQPHVARLLKGQKEPEKKVQHADLPPPKPLWHEDNRGRRGFHAEREQRGLTGHGAARAPRGPPSQLDPGGIRMLQAGLGAAVALPPNLYGGPPQQQQQQHYRPQQHQHQPPMQQPWGAPRPGMLPAPRPSPGGGYGGRGGGDFSYAQAVGGGHGGYAPDPVPRPAYGGRGGGFVAIGASQPTFQPQPAAAYGTGRPRPGARPAFGAVAPAYGQQPPVQQQYGGPQEFRHQPQFQQQQQQQQQYGRQPQYDRYAQPAPRQTQYGGAESYGQERHAQYAPVQQHAAPPGPYGQPQQEPIYQSANPFAPLIRPAGRGGGRRDPRHG